MNARIATPLIILLVAGCGGSGGGGDDGFDLIDQHDNLYESIFEQPRTAAINMPTGSLTYTGTALLETNLGDEFFDFVGDSRVDVNFAGDTVSGELSNMQRVLDDGDTVAYGGTVALENGGTNTTVGGDAIFDVGYNGTLTGEGNTLSIDGEIDGSFHGANGESLIGTNAFSPSMDTLNGEVVSVFVEVAAER